MPLSVLHHGLALHSLNTDNGNEDEEGAFAF